MLSLRLGLAKVGISWRESFGSKRYRGMIYDKTRFERRE